MTQQIKSRVSTHEVAGDDDASDACLRDFVDRLLLLVQQRVGGTTIVVVIERREDEGQVEAIVYGDFTPDYSLRGILATTIRRAARRITRPTE